MATTLFDLQITASSPGVTQGLSDASKNKLFRRPKIEEAKSKEAGTITRGTAELGEESNILELEDISEAYSELISRAENILDRMKNRLSGLTYTFDPSEQPALSEVLGRVFQNTGSEITYDMYLAALQLDKDIAVEIGESESGFVR